MPDEPNGDGTWLSAEQVYRLIGLESRSTLDSWARQRRGPVFYRIGSKRRYKRADVERWLSAQRVMTVDEQERQDALRPRRRPAANA